MASMAMAAGLSLKPGAHPPRPIRHCKGAVHLNPLSPVVSPHLRMAALSGRRLRLCVRAEVREPAFTEPEILPAEPNSSSSSKSSMFEQGEVTEAEFTEVSEQQQEQPQQPEERQAGEYNAEYDAQYEMDGGEAGEYDEEGGGGEYDESQYYDQSQYYDPSQYNPGPYDESQYKHDQFQYANAAAAANPEVEQAPAEPPPHYDNDGKVMKFIAVGRAMQLKMDSQKDFERFLDHCNAYGVMLPEKPGDIKRNLCELDPKETWIVVDSRAVLKFAKKLALEEAERNKDYPPGFVENMLNRDKYGRYKSDDD